MWKPKNFEWKYFPQMLSMSKEQYGAENDIANEEFLRHQYFDNPAGDALINLAVNDENGELAGQYVVWPMRFLVFGKQYICAHALNILTHHAYRGKQIFSRLGEITCQQEQECGHAYCYGTPNPNSYPGYITKLKFYELGAMPLMLKPLCSSQMAAEYLKKDILNIICKPANMLFPLPKQRLQRNVQFCEVTNDNVSRLDKFWEDVAGKYPIMNIKDSAFVQFRYLAMPRRTYFPYLAMHDGHPVCFAVGRIVNVSGMKCAMLVDFLFKDGFEDIAESLLKYLLGEMKKRGASLAGCLMFEHTKEYGVLKKLGFFRCPKMLEPQPFPLLVRKFDSSIEDEKLLNREHWFFTMGDYDAV